LPISARPTRTGYTKWIGDMSAYLVTTIGHDDGSSSGTNTTNSTSSWSVARHNVWAFSWSGVQDGRGRAQSVHATTAKSRATSVSHSRLVPCRSPLELIVLATRNAA
jgi:hypothetical protein